jgi:hypothetical protein
MARTPFNEPRIKADRTGKMGRDRHSRRDGATCWRRDHPIDLLTVKRADQRRNLSMPARVTGLSRCPCRRLTPFHSVSPCLTSNIFIDSIGLRVIGQHYHPQRIKKKRSPDASVNSEHPAKQKIRPLHSGRFRVLIAANADGRKNEIRMI